MLPALLTLLAAAPAGDYFVITVTDAKTGRGVPLVELRTVHGAAYHTDSNGVVAFREPGMMDQEVFFQVSGHGYEFPKDGFGFRGKRLHTIPGGSATLTVNRVNVAERLYRVTGGGIYRDSLLAGLKVPLKEPALNARVLGSDSVLTAVHRGKVHWFWGDTVRPAYPLGNYHVPGATSDLPGTGGLDPAAGVDLAYFPGKDGFAKETMRMPGDGPTWLTSLVPLPDESGKERLYGSFVKVKPPLSAYGRGLAVFDDGKQEFTKLADVPMNAPAFPDGHALRHGDHVYFAHPFPLVRTNATAADFLKIDSYESFTCLKDGSRLDAPKLDRGPDGRLRYAWRMNTPALGPKDEDKLVKTGSMKPEEVRWRLRDRETGKPVATNAGSVYWNAYRKRWVMIASEIFGTSVLGEVWYAEAADPVGPWRYAVKVVTHDKYSFYNPKQHPFFDQDGGRLIYFEGTYTHTFSGNPHPTPRYDYNQVMYRLDLSDPRVELPAAVYIDGPRFSTTPRTGAGDPRPAFYAPDRPLPGTVPVLVDANGLNLGKPGNAGAVFHAYPPDAKDPPAVTVPLYESHDRDDRRTYSTVPRQSATPLCRVWPAE